jgi:TolA-binding protein
MSDPIDVAMRRVEPEWTSARAARGLGRIGPSLRRRRRRRTALALTAAAGVAGVAAIFLGPWSPPSSAPPEARLTFPDGTTVRATVPATELRVAEDTPARRVVQVVRGGARFEVAHVPGRIFRVQLRAVAVEVLGTVFRVEEVRGRVRVAVERGRVRVQQGADRRELGAEQVLDLPAGPPEPPASGTVPVPVAGSGFPTASSTSAPAPPAAIVESAPKASPFARQPAAKATLGPRNGDPPGALLAAADRARRAGQPHAAMRPLRVLVARFPDDARAPLAAFTLGLLALDRNRPEEAAQAFALARRLEPAGELAEDALAREAQAWYEAGRKATAHDRATEYRRLYPAGRRAGSIRRLGDLP